MSDMTKWVKWIGLVLILFNVYNLWSVIMLAPALLVLYLVGGLALVGGKHILSRCGDTTYHIKEDAYVWFEALITATIITVCIMVVSRAVALGI